MKTAGWRLLGVGFLLGWGGVAPAWSHAHLQTAAPAPDSTVSTAPAEISLLFSEALESGFSGVTLTDAAGTLIPTGPAHQGAAGARQLVVPVASRLRPGSYRVEWHAFAVDGHRTQGRFVFGIGS